MNRIRNIQDASALNGVAVCKGLPAFDSANLIRHAVDGHWVLLDREERIAARVSLWWQSTPIHLGRRPGFIGHFAANDASAGRELLAHACTELRTKGCAMAMGPIDGNTWRNYRLVTESNGDPPFFLEPSHPMEWPRMFEQSGFSAVARYCSSVDNHLDSSTEHEREKQSAVRMHKLGVKLRTLDASRFPEELTAIHRVVTAGFRRGFLYQPVSEAEFLSQYQPVRPFVRPELVSIASLEDRMVGFIFTVPDLLEARAGRPETTVIIKTIAILPERRFAGLGTCLLAANRHAARTLGYRRMIHALMNESNKSRSISNRYTSVFRRYVLFAKPL